MPWTLSRPEQTILAGQAESSCLSHILLKPQCFRLWGPVQGHSVDSRREKLIPQNKLHSGRLTPTSRASVTWLVAYQSPLLKQANCLALCFYYPTSTHPQIGLRTHVTVSAFMTLVCDRSLFSELGMLGERCVQWSLACFWGVDLSPPLEVVLAQGCLRGSERYLCCGRCVYIPGALCSLSSELDKLYISF